MHIYKSFYVRIKIRLKVWLTLLLRYFTLHTPFLTLTDSNGIVIEEKHYKDNDNNQY